MCSSMYLEDKAPAVDVVQKKMQVWLHSMVRSKLAGSAYRLIRLHFFYV